MQKYGSRPLCELRKERYFNQEKEVRKEPQPVKIKGMVIACGKELQRVSRIETGSENLADNPIVLAKVAVDTSGLSKPLVKIDFATMIQIIVPTGINAFGAQLTFQLVRNCAGDREVLNNYQYRAEIRDNISFNFRQSFSFTYCDDDIFCQRDCCIYTVELIDIVVFTTNGDPFMELFIEDSAIRAVAQGICDGFQYQLCRQPVCEDVVLVCGKEKNTINLSPVNPAEFVPTVLAKLALDVNCTQKAQLALHFSTLIHVEEAEEAGFTEGLQLSFVLKRSCSGVEEVLRSYDYIKYLDRAEISYSLKNDFTFTYCDDQFICTKGCCTYTVELVNIRTLGTNTLVNRLVVEDSALNAILCD
jgi:hypothetical protein